MVENQNDICVSNKLIKFNHRHKKISGWDELIEQYNDKKEEKWIFRGENKLHTNLFETSLERAYNEKISDIGKYLFSWEKVPGNDSVRLIQFLMQNFNLEWIKAAKINKNDDDKTIRITNDTNFLSLTLNNEKNNVNIEIDDGRTDKFILKTENGEQRIYIENIFEFEKILIHEFQRRSHLYLKDTPNNENIVEWLGLMRHHGAPTRLLDWTYSFFIAVYFAIENPAEKEDKYCVWAINYSWLVETLKPIFIDNIEDLNKDGIVKKWNGLLDKMANKDREKIYNEKIFNNDKPTKSVFFINPYRLNERSVIQQSVFLCPGNPVFSFLDNLECNHSELNKLGSELSDYDYSQPEIMLYDILPDARKDILKNLYRMNINRAILFPGLDGFAASLSTSPLFRNR